MRGYVYMDVEGNGSCKYTEKGFIESISLTSMDKGLKHSSEYTHSTTPSNIATSFLNYVVHHFRTQ